MRVKHVNEYEHMKVCVVCMSCEHVRVCVVGVSVSMCGVRGSVWCMCGCECESLCRRLVCAREKVPVCACAVQTCKQTV